MVSGGGVGCAISDYKLHVTHLDVGIRRNPGPLEEKKHTLCHTQTEVYELLPDSLCVLVLVSVRACACVTTAVRPSGHLLSKATPEAQGVLRFLFLCAICAGNKVWGLGWGGVGSGGYALGKKKTCYANRGSIVQAHNTSCKEQHFQHVVYF